MGENRPALTHIFSVQHAAPFSHAQGCANGSLHGAAKYYESGNNALRAAHLHDDMKSYGSETEAMCPFSGKPLDTTMVIMLHRKVMWQDQSTPPGANPLQRLTYSKYVENLSVGKTKSYWTNNSQASPVWCENRSPACKVEYETEEKKRELLGIPHDHKKLPTPDDRISLY